MLLPLIIRTRFKLTSRKRALKTIEYEGRLSSSLARSVAEGKASQSVEVPAMIGIDPEMRNWSLMQTLEHNVIVNRSITDIVQTLSKEKPYISHMNPKTDVLPGLKPGIEQIALFEESVADHINAVSKIESLRSRQKQNHPIFGPFNAHAWNCMFGFHLWLHRRQIEKAIERL